MTKKPIRILVRSLKGCSMSAAWVYKFFLWFFSPAKIFFPFLCLLPIFCGLCFCFNFFKFTLPDLLGRHMNEKIATLFISRFCVYRLQELSFLCAKMMEKNFFWTPSYSLVRCLWKNLLKSFSFSPFLYFRLIPSFLPGIKKDQIKLKINQFACF